VITRTARCALFVPTAIMLVSQFSSAQKILTACQEFATLACACATRSRTLDVLMMRPALFNLPITSVYVSMIPNRTEKGSGLE
jgi:hypothetical protein